MTPERKAAGEDTDVYVAQQRVIVDILKQCSGASEVQIEHRLRHTLESRNLPVPPRSWVRAVADEISHDHLYVVANGMVPNDYFSGSAGRRAATRVDLSEHDLEPPESTRKRLAEGKPTGNQIA